MFRLLPLLLVFALATRAGAIDAATGQLALSIAGGWNSSSGRMQLFERDGRGWRAVAPPWRVLYGKNGLAWGRGEHSIPEASSAPVKQEHDRRAPAGIFRIGKIYTYDTIEPRITTVYTHCDGCDRFLCVLLILSLYVLT